MRLQRGRKWSEMLQRRERNQKRLSTDDRGAWYLPTMELLSTEATDKFHLSVLDSSTQQFLDDSQAASAAFCLQIYYSFASAFLSFFLSKTSINGLLNRGGMHLFSSEQFRDFMRIPPEWISRDKVLLDLGSGDGGVTQVLAAYYSTVHVTEMSQVMQWRLRQRNYVVVDALEWHQSPSSYHLISALNLLDRHFAPRWLLRQLYDKALDSNCHVLLSLVLPIRPYVEFRPTGKSPLSESALRVIGATLEEQVDSLMKGELAEAGFEVVRWTKLPYLCEGDFHYPFYTLDDVAFLLRPVAGHRHPTKSSPDFIVHETTGHIDL